MPKMPPNLPDICNTGEKKNSLAVHPVEYQTVAVTGVGGGGGGGGVKGGPASPGCRLDKHRLSRPWVETLVDFEARLKYSQSYHRHPLI